MSEREGRELCPAGWFYLASADEYEIRSRDNDSTVREIISLLRIRLREKRRSRKEGRIGT